MGDQRPSEPVRQRRSYIALTSQLRLPGVCRCLSWLVPRTLTLGSISNRTVDDDSRPWFSCTGASPSPIYRDGISEMIEPRGMNPSFREPAGCLARYRYLSVSEARQGTNRQKKNFFVFPIVVLSPCWWLFTRAGVKRRGRRCLEIGSKAISNPCSHLETCAAANARSARTHCEFISRLNRGLVVLLLLRRPVVADCNTLVILPSSSSNIKAPGRQRGCYERE